MAIALAGWGVRNYNVLGKFLTGSSRDGLAFWESIYPSAREGLLTRGQTEGLSDERLAKDYAVTRSFPEADVNRYFFRRAVDYTLTHPIDVAKTALLKIAISMLGIRTTEPLRTLRNTVGLVSNAALLLLAALGLRRFHLRATVPQQLLWRCMAAASLFVFVALSIVGPIGVRYRMSLEPVLWIFAAGFLLSVIKIPAGKTL
jgi:hypothetical protein